MRAGEVGINVIVYATRALYVFVYEGARANNAYQNEWLCDDKLQSQ